MEVSRKQLIELIRIAKNEVKGSSPRTPTQLAKAFENSINGRNELEQGALSENKEVKPMNEIYVHGLMRMYGDHGRGGN